MVFLLYYWGMHYIHVASAKIYECVCIDILIHPRSTLPLRSSWWLTRQSLQSQQPHSLLAPFLGLLPDFILQPWRKINHSCKI